MLSIIKLCQNNDEFFFLFFFKQEVSIGTPGSASTQLRKIDIRKMTFNIYLNINDVTSFNPVTCFKENARIITFTTNFVITYSCDKL